MSLTELQDARVSIVGARGAGIGKAAARPAAAYGARLVIVDRDGDEADRVTSEIRASDGEAYSVQADITDDRQVQRMVTTAVERLGGIDGAFNNVGGSPSLVGEHLSKITKVEFT
jgi:NAD(P)-dependent dehydrogenase (short-subunit alcohol dehydrogenase family)